MPLTLHSDEIPNESLQIQKSPHKWASIIIFISFYYFPFLRNNNLRLFCISLKNRKKILPSYKKCLEVDTYMYFFQRTDYRLKEPTHSSIIRELIVDYYCTLIFHFSAAGRKNNSLKKIWLLKRRQCFNSIWNH